MSKAQNVITVIDEGAWDTIKKGAKEFGKAVKGTAQVAADMAKRQGLSKTDLENMYKHLGGYDGIRNKYYEFRSALDKAKKAKDKDRIQYLTYKLNQFAVAYNYATKRAAEEQSDQDFKYRKYEKDKAAGDPNAKYASRYDYDTTTILNKHNLGPKASGASRASMLKQAYFGG